MKPDRDYSHMVGDARKRIADSITDDGQFDYSVTRDEMRASFKETQAAIDDLRVKARIRSALILNHDEQHAHLHEWPDMDDS